MKKIYLFAVLFLLNFSFGIAQSIYLDPASGFPTQDIFAEETAFSIDGLTFVKSSVVNPIENIMAKVSDDDIQIDLSNVFTDPDNEDNFSYAITVNSFPEIAQTQINNDQLIISFLANGQTNITIEATSQGEPVEHSFVIGVQPDIAGDYIVSGFEELSLGDESFWNGSDESGGFESGLVFFPNDHNTEWGTWTGWAYSNITDNTTPGWLNQYSAVTGAALEGDDENPGIYTLSYASGAGSVLKYNNPSSHEVKGIFLTNSTYAALSMMYGDDFSKKFGGETGDDPDWFKLTINGMKDGEQTEAIDYYLADYRFEDNTKNYIIQTWQWIELSSLGKVDSLMFSLSSSDTGDWGMNTPSYFAADNIYIVPDLAPVVSNPIDDITVDINSEPLVLDISGVFTDSDDSNEEILVSVYDNTDPDLVQASLQDYQLTLDFSPEQSGEATITLYAVSNGKSVSETFQVTLLPGTRVAGSSQQKLKVYPNPSNGKFFVVFDGAKEAQLSVFNLAGQTVHQSRVSQGVHSVDIAAMPAGTYILRLQDESEVRTIRIVKQ